MSQTVALPKDYRLEVANGNVPGVKMMQGFGERDSIGTTAAGEDLVEIQSA